MNKYSFLLQNNLNIQLLIIILVFKNMVLSYYFNISIIGTYKNSIKIFKYE